MKTVRLSILEHRGKRCIKIDFPIDDELKIAVDKIQGRKWSQTNKCWYVYDTPGNLYYARDKFRITDLIKSIFLVNTMKLLSVKE